MNGSSQPDPPFLPHTQPHPTAITISLDTGVISRELCLMAEDSRVWQPSFCLAPAKSWRMELTGSHKRSTPCSTSRQRLRQQINWKEPTPARSLEQKHALTCTQFSHPPFIHTPYIQSHTQARRGLQENK
ncbi:hypothetical protein C0Q70_00684 [Pomacea canaliculata]|uniref:Uncharacterized protein n=1 Tax=Pomacea canaliculata TaxID=400727 RepID=A0A2T7PXB5_POMCA|nr:hypothetical protein C0Q70_00684 [Pomacea canaliculata]